MHTHAHTYTHIHTHTHARTSGTQYGGAGSEQDVFGEVDSHAADGCSQGYRCGVCV